MTQIFACQIDETLGLGEDPPMKLRYNPQKKDITYGPPPKHLVAAIRKELRRLLDLPDLDANLGAIGRFAMQADDLLMHVKAPEAVMRDEHEITLPAMPNTAPNVETYGATILRELVSGGMQKHDAAEHLVEAIATARRAGMPDVAAALEVKLTGKALDGARPVTGALPTVESLLAPCNGDHLGPGGCFTPVKPKKKVIMLNGRLTKVPSEDAS